MALVADVRAAMDGTLRSSSMVENLNSRLRRYFFLRCQLGDAYLSLLQFFLNHRVFMRSRRAERVGKTPKQLLTGQVRAHWLELLGFEPCDSATADTDAPGHWRSASIVALSSALCSRRADLGCIRCPPL